MKKLLALLLAMTLLIGLLAGCAKEDNAVTDDSQSDNQPSSTTETPSSDEPVTIRVSTLNQQLSVPIYYIQKMGWDIENGFKLEISTFAQGTGINEALGSGLVDVFTIGAAGISSCAVYDAVYLFSHEDSGAGQQFMIRNNSDIAQTQGYNPDFPEIYGTPETVAGKMFLLPMGGAAQLLADIYLEALGLTEDDVSLVNMDDTAIYAAFSSGQGDFGKTSYPSADLFDPAEYTVACSMGNLNVPYYDNVLCSREFFEDPSKHDALVSLCVQMIRAAEAFQDDQTLMDATLEWYDINGQVCDPEDIEHQVLARPYFTYDDLTTIDYSSSFKIQADFYETVGNITQEDLEKVYANMDSTIIQEALEVYAAQYRN